jgi:hypothetical protein
MDATSMRHVNFVNPRLHSHHYPSARTQVGIVSSPWSTILTWFTPLLEHQSPLLNDLEFLIVLIDHFSWSFWHKTLRWSNMRIFCGTKHTKIVLKIRMLTCCLSINNAIVLLTLRKEHDPHSNPFTTCLKMN